MRKQLIIVGHSQDGLDLVPLLEANPAVEVCALVSDDPAAVHERLGAQDASLAARFADRVTSDLEAALATPDLTAVIDADASAAQRRRFGETRGVQVTTPVLAKLLFGFGNADAFSKPELLQALREMLDSYDLALDRRALLDRVLQIAVSTTGADRASVMLWDPERRVLRVEAALGIEEEVIPKIQVPSGEGVAGRAFAVGRPILLNGKAERGKYQITRERDDVESAISAPLVHNEQVIGVLNVSHARDQNVFDSGDLEFVEQLARLDARLIARAEEYHGLLQESATLRAEAQVRRLMGGPDGLAVRLENVCRFVAQGAPGSLCQLYLVDESLSALLLRSSSAGVPALGVSERVEMGEGLPGWVARARERIFLNNGVGDSSVYYACFPLVVSQKLLGVMAYQGADGDSDAKLLEARLAAAAAALSEELDEALRRARLERESRRTTVLSELFAALSECHDRDELHGIITSSTATILEAQDVVLRLREGDTGRFRIVSWTGIGQWREAPLAQLEKQIASEAIRTRRTVRLSDLTADESVAAEIAGVGSAIVHPLTQDERVIGTVSALGKIPEEPLLGELFDEADEQILQRLAQHAQVCLNESSEVDFAGERVDPETGLLGPRALRARLDEELARSRRRQHPLLLVQLRFEGLPNLKQGAELAAGLADALRLELRDFDVLARPTADTLAALLPEPEAELPRLLAALNRIAQDALEQHGPDAAGVALQIGYARYPEDGADAAELEALSTRTRVETA